MNVVKRDGMVMARKLMPMAVAFHWKGFHDEELEYVVSGDDDYHVAEIAINSCIEPWGAEKSDCWGDLEADQVSFFFWPFDLFGSSKDECSSGSGVWSFGSSSSVAVELLLRYSGSESTGVYLPPDTTVSSKSTLSSHLAGTLCSIIVTRNTKSKPVLRVLHQAPRNRPLVHRPRLPKMEK